jgi:hypothetical protein
MGISPDLNGHGAIGGAYRSEKARPASAVGIELADGHVARHTRVRVQDLSGRWSVVALGRLAQAVRERTRSVSCKASQETMEHRMRKE